MRVPAASVRLLPRFLNHWVHALVVHSKLSTEKCPSPCAGPVFPDWFSGCSTSNAYTIQSALALDPATFLNVYLCQPAGGVLGFVTRFPQQAPEGDRRHGVFASFDTIPGGGAPNYNLGMTIVHESARLRFDSLTLMLCGLLTTAHN